jgi:RNA-directed DNA polymerase
MTARPVQAAGAASQRTVDWDQIDLDHADRIVRGLQARIVKATRAGKGGKVKALQHLLTHSFSGKVLAIERVTGNKGKNTPGVDQVLWRHDRSKEKAIGSLKQHGYKPLPLKRVLIPKPNGKMRPLGIPTMKDRAMQALYLLALDPVLETLSDPNSYGFRKKRCCADAIEQCFIALARRDSAQWIFEGDIKACFDKMSHPWLMKHVPMDKTILGKWLKAGYLEKNAFRETTQGAPQGGIISPALANCALNGLEAVLAPWTSRKTVQGRTAKVNLIRYADDFVITGNSKELLEQQIKPLVEQFLCERGLELSAEKTRITHIDDGFDFVGQNVRKYKGKMLIKPAEKNVKRFLENKIRKVIKENKQTPAYELIGQLNPKIRGWANYHKAVVSKKTFGQVDTAIYKCLWQWGKRRHPDKNRHWVKEKYFGTHRDRKWTFFGEKRKDKGEPMVKNWLTRATDTPIVRHVKIQGRANPYDPEWKAYFEKRQRRTKRQNNDTAYETTSLAEEKAVSMAQQLQNATKRNRAPTRSVREA